MVSVISLVVAALASEVAFRGFLFRRLIDATGPATATILLSGDLCADREPRARTGRPQLRGDHYRRACCFRWPTCGRMPCGWGGGCTSRGRQRRRWCSGCRLRASRATRAWSRPTRAAPLWLTGGVYGPDGALFTAIVFCRCDGRGLSRDAELCVELYACRDCAGAAIRWMFRRPRRTRRWSRPRLRRRLTLVQIAPAPSSNGSERSSSPESAHRP